MDEPLNTAPPPAPRGQPWARTTLWICLASLLVGASLFVFKSCMEAPERVVDRTTRALATVAAAFHRGNVSTSFVSYATALTNNLYLQVATLNQMELFTRTETPMTGYGYIPLPDVVVEARAPVEYTYYLNLNDEWRFVLENQTIRVQAPPIRFNKPSVDASAITYEVRKGLLKSDVAMANLKRAITSLVSLRARQNIHLVRENARRQTAQFVKVWLMNAFTDGERFAIEVVFSDEPGVADPLPVNLETPTNR